MDEPLRILIVDDNPRDRSLVRHELHKEYPNVAIVEAVDQEQLDRVMNEDTFDLVITDYQLQWSNGIRVLNAVKARHPNCPVIMFTATGNEEIAVEAMKSGLDDYIVKNVQHLVRLRSAAQAALKHAETARQVERLQARLGSLLSRLRVGVFRCSCAGRLLEVNEAFVRILGLPSTGSLIGQEFGSFLVESKQYERNLCRLLETKEPQEFELRGQKANGQVIWLEIGQSLHQPSEGEAVVEGLVEDITARKRAEDEMQVKDLAMAHFSRLATLGEMVAGIAHEINQPLNAIGNYATGSLLKLQHGCQDADEMRGPIEKIAASTRHAGEIIQRYRQFASRQKLQESVVDLNGLVQEALELVAFELRDCQVSVENELATPGPTVLGDRVQISQVIVNLVRNASQAMNDNEGNDRRLVVGTNVTDDSAEVSVKDHGNGLPQVGFEELLTPFFTTKPDGIGMGLAVCSRIVEAHGGRLWATGNEDRGATFRFALPLQKGRAEND